MAGILRKLSNSLLFRSADILYDLFPKRAVLKFYCRLTYMLRTIAWKLACRYYGAGIVRYRGGIDAFILSHIRNGDSVLDVGCAEGHLSAVAAKKAKSVTSVDIDSKYIAKAFKGLENVKFMVGNILDMEFDEIFDAAILIHSVEHMAESEKVFMHISSLARRIIVEAPSQEADWLSEMLEEMGIREMGDDKHVRLYDRASLKDELERNGWTNVLFHEANGAVRLTADSKTLKRKKDDAGNKKAVE